MKYNPTLNDIYDFLKGLNAEQKIIKMHALDGNRILNQPILEEGKETFLCPKH